MFSYENVQKVKLACLVWAKLLGVPAVSVFSFETFVNTLLVINQILG